GWMLLGLPVVILMGFACWWLLTKKLFPVAGLNTKQSARMIERTHKSLGRMKKGERRVAVIALLTAAGWVFGNYLREYIPALSDSVIAMLGALSLFVVP